MSPIEYQAHFTNLVTKPCLFFRAVHFETLLSVQIQLLGSVRFGTLHGILSHFVTGRKSCFAVKAVVD